MKALSRFLTSWFMVGPYWLGRKGHYFLYCSGTHVPQHVDAANSLFCRTAYCLGKKSVVCGKQTRRVK